MTMDAETNSLPLSDDDFAAMAKALGHPARVAIVRHLAAEEIGRASCRERVESRV